MTVQIGNLTFDRVRYDADGDVLYLHRGDPNNSVDFDASPEGHAVAVVAIAGAVYLVLAGQVLGAAVVAAALVIIVFLKSTSPGDAREWREFQARRDQRPGTPGH